MHVLVRCLMLQLEIAVALKMHFYFENNKKNLEVLSLLLQHDPDKCFEVRLRTYTLSASWDKRTLTQLRENTELMTLQDWRTSHQDI